MGKRFSIGGGFVPRTLEMYRSSAWQHLPDNARRVLARLELEHLEHGGAENGKLVCTYNNFAADGLRRASVSLAIRQCIALGFVTITRRGKRSIAEHRTPTLYRLTYVLDRYADGGKREPTHEWRRIKTDDDALLALLAAAKARNSDTQPCPKIKKLDAPLSPVPGASVGPVASLSRTQ